MNEELLLNINATFITNGTIIISIDLLHKSFCIISYFSSPNVGKLQFTRNRLYAQLLI